MRSHFPILLAVLLAVLSSSCSRDQAERLAKLVSPTYPKNPATHVVELYKVQIGAPDFNFSTFGNPLDIKVSLYEDGRELGATTSNLISGTRGERILRQPIQWTVNFDPRRTYQVVVEEQSIIAQAVRWCIPATPKIGYWPIAENNGKIDFGRESYLQFRDRVAE